MQNKSSKTIWFIGVIAVAIGAGAFAFYSTQRPSIKNKSPNIAISSAAPAPVNSAPIVQKSGFEALSEGQKLETAFSLVYRGKNGANNGLSQENVEFAPGKLVKLSNSFALIAIGEVRDAAHADGGIVSIHYLSPSQNGLKIEKSYEAFEHSGSFGQLADWGVNYKLSDNPTIFVEGGGTWQGTTCAFTSLIELYPNGPKKVFSTITYIGNGNGHSEGKIRNIVKNQSFDIVFTGNSKGRHHYVRKDGVYISNSKAELEC